MPKLVAITGAGISKASNIPTFVEMGNLRDKLSRDYFHKNPEDFYQSLLEMKKLIDIAEPNDAHKVLFEYDVSIITMNIDGLHSKAGSKDGIEVHGNLDFVYCNRCNKEYDFNKVLKGIKCHKCGEILDTNVVLYGDNIKDFHKAIDLVVSSDRILVIGTSFYTSTVNYLVSIARTNEIPVDIINEQAEINVRKYLKELFQ
ncbi:transcriptional regulator [Clostridium sp. D2Q-14]|uniref:SIR2 family NAD-dependent protein deacylase n=1 Tax=Anaeromonas gelatinilytica TaxID=2683194 RepID=UPI00193B96A6|nr:Sir2 family NAD-dependent protein deacetylase [Anaeromonas gelatinilytica]MBS4534440.1 transcriptional regulator [Anaeromonas gelatinilytica]